MHHALQGGVDLWRRITLFFFDQPLDDFAAALSALLEHLQNDRAQAGAEFALIETSGTSGNVQVCASPLSFRPYILTHHCAGDPASGMRQRGKNHELTFPCRKV